MYLPKCMTSWLNMSLPGKGAIPTRDRVITNNTSEQDGMCSDHQNRNNSTTQRGRARRLKRQNLASVLAEVGQTLSLIDAFQRWHTSQLCLMITWEPGGKSRTCCHNIA